MDFDIMQTDVYKKAARAAADATALGAMADDRHAAIWMAPVGEKRKAATRAWFDAKSEHDEALVVFFVAEMELARVCRLIGVDFASLTA